MNRHLKTLTAEMEKNGALRQRTLEKFENLHVVMVSAEEARTRARLLRSGGRFKMLGDPKFIPFLRQLITGGKLNGEALGIARQLLKTGPRSLTSTEGDLLETALERYLVSTCRACDQKIQWNEMYQALVTGRCLACQWGRLRSDARAES
jgi:hypothetical protein